MYIELDYTAQAKLEDLLEIMTTQYSMDELTADDLIEALIDLGSDLIVSEDGSMPIGRANLVDYCASKIRSRSI